MQVREELTSEVRKYLVGPYDKDEQLGEPPDSRYISGIMFPSGTELEEEEKEQLKRGKEEKEKEEDSGKENQRQFYQTSLGITCNLKINAKKIDVKISYARYVHIDDKWKRVPTLHEKTIDLSIKSGTIEIHDKNDADESSMTWIIDDDYESPPRFKVLTVFVSNEMPNPFTKKGLKELPSAVKKRIRTENSIFQAHIEISSKGESPFSDNSFSDDSFHGNPETDSLNLLFRNRKTFAQGHGCAANWDLSKDPPPSIWTEIIPTYVERAIKFDSKNDHHPSKISMKEIAEASSPEIVEDILIKNVVSKYEDWINKITNDKKNIDGELFSQAAEFNVKKCGETLQRIKDGLLFLKDRKNQSVFEAFKLANKAMLMQRQRFRIAIAKSKGVKPKQEEDYWRPFQIAFIIMNLKSIAQKDFTAERDIVDLLWLPTAAGKTEAYLGLAAYAILLRRITGAKDSDGGLGVSVILRYTLRLLTLNQFERAATLFCALEIIRRDPQYEKKFGQFKNEPFLLGLWVGYSLTPTSYDSSRLSLKQGSGQSSPAQLNFCPWCGEKINEGNFRTCKENKWTIAHCKSEGCRFYAENKYETDKALPIVTVDTDIYARCPAMIIATVDKIARLPLNENISHIFGRVDRKCSICGFVDDSHPTHRGKSVPVPCSNLHPPDLIIQDELHLISGPLGSMTGLYETAVDFLCSEKNEHKTYRPKVIVSTATVNGVNNQVRKLFNRRITNKFPPSGIEWNDSFFWWEDEKPGKMYVGVSFSFRSGKYALARLYASLLQRVYELSKDPSKVGEVDPYWTLVGYFNSTRELGGAIRLVESDVEYNLGDIIELYESHKEFGHRKIAHKDELTGRVKQNDIARIREQVEKPFDSGHAIDVLLATNMISVGIDISRLGLMVVFGQPKNSSEYIQATGRVGRSSKVPGLVFTLNNMYNPRDASHYENFIGFHRNLQKFVEPVSITPFSEKAIERGCHGVLIGLIRQSISELSSNDTAGNIVDSFDDPLISEIKNAILNRCLTVEDIDKDDSKYLILNDRIKKLLEDWKNYSEKWMKAQHDVYYWDTITDSPISKYGIPPRAKTKFLMKSFGRKRSEGEEDTEYPEFPIDTPESLRDVESDIRFSYTRLR